MNLENPDEYALALKNLQYVIFGLNTFPIEQAKTNIKKLVLDIEKVSHPIRMKQYQWRTQLILSKEYPAPDFNILHQAYTQNNEEYIKHIEETLALCIVTSIIDIAKINKPFEWWSFHTMKGDALFLTTQAPNPGELIH